MSPSNNPNTIRFSLFSPRWNRTSIHLLQTSSSPHSFFVSAFQTLTLAKKYALDKGKPFPEIDDQIMKEKDWPKDCYVFEGKEKEPTIVYMPLFNRANCKGLFPFPPSDSPVLLQWPWFLNGFPFEFVRYCPIFLIAVCPGFKTMTF